MTGLVVNGVRTQTPVKENDDPEAFPFQTTQTRLNRWTNTRDSANSVFSTRSLYVFSNRNNGSAKRSTTRVGKTEEARVFRENFYGGKIDFLLWFKFFKAWIKRHFVHVSAIKVPQDAPLNQTVIKTPNLHFTRTIGTFSCSSSLLLPSTFAYGYAIREEISVFSGESFRCRSHLSFFIARMTRAVISTKRSSQLSWETKRVAVGILIYLSLFGYWCVWRVRWI